MRTYSMLLYSLVLSASLFLLAQPSLATHQVEYRTPENIATTVGELTTLQIDIKNGGTVPEYYTVTITSAVPNEISITNPSITTPTLNPGESTSIFSNIHTLTESDNTITISIFQKGDMGHAVTAPAIPVKSKKYSLPEFGLAGLAQIIVLSTTAFFFLRRKS